MKKVSLLLVLVTMPLLASADAVLINGVYYHLIPEEKKAEVARNPDGYSGSVVIQESFNYEGVDYTVTSIGDGAFFLGDLISITIPKSVTYIGESSFYECVNLTAVHISDIAAWCNITYFPNSNNPLRYAHHLYLGNDEITNLVIPDGVTSIGERAFSGCSGLTSVTIPSSVTSIGTRAFEECESLTSVEIPNSVTSIGSSAFRLCTGLTSITLSDKMTKINHDTFNGCSSLTSVTIPNSVTSIGSGAFERCSGLTSIDIPNSVTSIEGGAFSRCSGLTTIFIGKGVESIGSGAFANCTNLADVYCFAESVPSSGNTIFYESSVGDATLHVPVGMKNQYEAATPWKDFGTIVEDITVGIKSVARDAKEAQYIQMNGINTKELQRGTNIIRTKDGKTMKVWVK